MTSMRITPTALPEVLMIEPMVHRDDRGFFLESYHYQKYHLAGLNMEFVQDNHSQSKGGTLRGLHAQRYRPQGKLIRVIRGEIFDVAVDIRRGAPSFAQWVGLALTAENFTQCYIPPGFAHGFYVLSPEAQIEYKCSEYYDPTDELVIRWDDPTININWPVSNPILSPKDQRAPYLADVMDHLPQGLEASP